MKDYERLTARVENKVIFAGDLLNTPNYEKAIIDRLAELEDKIESGKLVELPCPLGSTVYVIEETRTTSGKFVFGQIEECIFDSEEFDFDSLRDFGNTIFTTKEAAEAKLEELRGEK